MVYQKINNTQGSADSIRAGLVKANQNFSELYGQGASTFQVWATTTQSNTSTAAGWTTLSGAHVANAQITSLADMNVSGLAAGQWLVWNGTSFVNQNRTLSNLSDVVITNAVSGQYLTLNSAGNSWVNTTFTGAYNLVSTTATFNGSDLGPYITGLNGIYRLDFDYIACSSLGGTTGMAMVLRAMASGVTLSTANYSYTNTLVYSNLSYGESAISATSIVWMGTTQVRKGMMGHLQTGGIAANTMQTGSLDIICKSDGSAFFSVRAANLVGASNVASGVAVTHQSQLSGGILTSTTCDGISIQFLHLNPVTYSYRLYKVG